MRIGIGSDHAGFQLKRVLVSHLREIGQEVRDFGTFDETPIDYPDISEQVARAVASGEVDRGILVCGTGIGSCIAANKVPGIRAALCHDVYSARMSREHNNANILCLGQRVVGTGHALEVVDAWLAAEFSEESRHQRRVAKIAEIERRSGNSG